MKTAVQIAIESIKNDYEFHGRLRPAFVFEQLNKAEIEEKQQIIDAGDKCQIYNDGFVYENGEQYYDETFGK